MPTADQIAAQLDRLASIDTGPFPVISLYLDLRPNERGRDAFEPFLRKELTERVATYPAAGPERESLERDAEKIRDYVAAVDSSLNGLALFACAGADLFDAIPMAAPVDAHRLYIAAQPHLYPLARILDEYPRYAVLLADTHSARVFVFAANAVVKTEAIESPKTKHHKKGGWSQARYQRHTENFHVHHAKEVVDALERVVREEGIETVLLSGDEVILPLLRDQMPKQVADRIVDVVKLDVRAPEHEVLETAVEALREHDAATDRERVDEMIGAYRAHGLATVGAENVRRALELGQVDELVIAATPDSTDEDNDLVRQARNTSASIRFIQDVTLLEGVGGVGAFLRFRA
jgi:peptide subunit release factor 1 (eRF1)